MKSECLYYTIEEGNESYEQEKSAAMVILRHHLHENFKAQYLTITELEVLWRELKDRYNHQPTITLPNARSCINFHRVLGIWEVSWRKLGTYSLQKTLTLMTKIITTSICLHPRIPCNIRQLMPSQQSSHQQKDSLLSKL
ncbi:hypothetical protein ACOSP7_021200 [Xanthoceras sorbifolium]